MWGASGKHPVVKDYIRIGQAAGHLEIMYRWVEEGYPRVAGSSRQHSWRFFARGLRPGDLSLGLLRDSLDGAGRPFPFLIMGTGRIDGWEQRWVFLPGACDGIWERMEFLCARRVFDLEELKGDINRLPPPSLTGQAPAGTDEPGGVTMPQPESGMVAIPLTGTGDRGRQSVHLLELMDAHYRKVPEAVFIGGSMDKDYLVGFFGPLHAGDFVRLWTLDTGNAV
jgi:type VI secretion system protein VasJ